MKENLVFHRDFYRPGPFVSMQLMTSAYCELIAWEYDHLSAPFWRWYFNANRGAYIYVNKKRIALEPGKIYLIPPHVDFASTTKHIVSHLYFTFVLNVNLRMDFGRVFSHTVTSFEKRLIRQLIPLVQQGQEISFIAQTLIGLALGWIPKEYWSANRLNTKIERAVRIIHDQSLQSVSNAELARIVGMNTNAFIRLFHQHIGCSPHQYDLRLRIEKACWLLRSSEDGLEKIAEITGFYDRFHFSKAFKRYIRITPAAYRRQKQGRGKNSLA
jgi:AraC-like DNA-binding protein